MLLSLFLQTKFQESIDSPLSRDTEIRERLLAKKKLVNVYNDSKLEDGLIGSSINYSNLLVDFVIDTEKTIKLIDYENHSEHSFSNKYNKSRVFFKNSGTIEITNKDCEALTIYDNSGRVVRSFEFKSEKISFFNLEPGIKLFKVHRCISKGSLYAEFKSKGKNIETINIQEIDIRLNKKEKELNRLISLSKTKKANIVKVAGSLIKTKLIANDKEYSVNIKLAGRTAHHLSWFPSIDVDIVGGNSYRGMTSFKLYRLNTKSGLHDIVLMSILKDLGFLTPRVDIIKLKVNSVNEGFYYLMESPSAPYIVNNQRVDGDIVGTDNNKLMFNYPINGTLDKNLYFNARNKFHNKASKQDYLNGLNNQLDNLKISSYVGFLSAFASGHGLGIDDLRFYYNPISLKYEPIPRDLNPGMTLKTGDLFQSIDSNALWVFGTVLNTIYPGWEVNDVGARSLTDYHFAVSSYLSKESGYKKTLEYLKYYLGNPIFFEKIKNRSLNLSKFIPELKVYSDDVLVYLENILLYTEEFENIIMNIEKVRSLGSAGDHINYILPKNSSSNFDEEELANIMFIEKEIRVNVVPKTTIVEEKVNQKFLRKNDSCLNNYLAFKGYQPIDDESYYAVMLVRNSLITNNKTGPTMFNRDTNSFLTPIIQNSIFLQGQNGDCASSDDMFNDRYRSNEKITILKYKIDHKSDSFFRFYNKRFIYDLPTFFYFLGPKNQKIQSDYLNTTPEVFKKESQGYSLEGEGKYELSSGIDIENSSLYVKGAKNNPIIFTGLNDSNWDGLRINCNGGDLHLENVIFKNYGQFPYTNNNGNFYTGGVSIYQCNVYIKNVKFLNSQSEDALNIINSKVFISNLHVENTKSDGVDLDFSYGKIDNMTANIIGGDALDLSFSSIDLNNSSISNVKDKGISVGENSLFSVHNSEINSTDIGIAVKDQSTANIQDVLLIDNNIGIATYIKKPYFGIPVVTSSNVVFKNNQQNNSWMGFRPE